MKNIFGTLTVMLVAMALFAAEGLAQDGPAGATQRFREKLDRGVVAVPARLGTVYIGWRLLADDPADIAFNVYRRSGNGPASKLNDAPIAKTTDFTDRTPPAGSCEYFVRAVLGDEELPPSPSFPLRATVTAPATASTRPAKGGPPLASYVSLPLLGKYTVKDIAFTDLDGDGRLDYVVKQPDINIDPADPYWKKSPGIFRIEAYRHDGTPMWQYDLGWSIEQGVWYSPYLVYDFDGDGKAEVAVKIGEGDPRDADGRVQTGPEFLAILDGATGKEIARAHWPSRDLLMSEKYNRASRNQLCLACLDGKKPSIIVNRGTYNRIILEAYDFRDRKLRRLWQWDNKNLPRNYAGQGSHMVQAADVNGDGRDEVIVGSCVIGADGKELWTTGLGHPDSVYIGKLNPSRDGLQIYYNIEARQPRNGMCMVDAATGKILWGYDKPTKHVHSHGLCSDIDPARPGWECYGADSIDHKFVCSWLWDCSGQLLSDSQAWNFGPFTAWWDDDLQRELILKDRVVKYDGPALSTIEGKVLAVADILGDWREEIIACVGGEIRIYVSTIPAADGRTCLLQDPIYRMCTVRQTSGYYQVPSISYDLGSRTGGR